MDWYNRHELLAMGIQVGDGCMISRRVQFMGTCSGKIKIGYNTRIDADVKLMAGAKDAYINIGSHVHIAVNAVLMGAGGIQIGDFATVGINSTIVSASDDFSGDYLIGPTVSYGEWGNVQKKQVELEDHAIITTGCTVLPGVTMWQGSVLGAMSLATKDLDEWSIHAGIPARKIKGRSRKAFELGKRFDADYNPF